MQGQAQVVDYLKSLLKGELAARDQYFLHSRMYADWGFTKLYERINHEMEEETLHADVLLERILFLQGTPDMTPEAINPGTDVPSMLRSDLALEYSVRDALAKGIELCEQARSEEHTSELQSRENLVCRLLLEKKKSASGSA